MIPIGDVVHALHQWGIPVMLATGVQAHVPATEAMVRCAESSARLMADASRRRMMQ